MRTYMARLGNFQFGMDTAAFNELKRASSFRWESKNRIGRRPAMQNTGRDADTISLSGTIYPHWRGGLGQMAALRAMAASGKAQPLVYAFENAGQYCGLWCITSIDETRTVLFDNGGPRKIEFSLTLREYGEDGDAAQLVPAFAADVTNVLSQSNLGTAVDTAGAVTQASTMAAGVQGITTQAGAVSAMSSVASTITSVTRTISGGISAVMNSDAVKVAKTTVASVNELRARAKALENGANGLRAALKDPSRLPAALSSMGTAASAATDAMTKASAGLVLTGGKYRGTSPDTLYSKQVNSSSGVLTQLASASTSIKSTVNKLGSLF